MQQKDQGSPFGLEDAQAFIAKAKWTYAVTVPQHPHEYSLRRWLPLELQADFDALAAMIAREGCRGRFWQQDWIYLDVGEHKYFETGTLRTAGASRAASRLASIKMNMITTTSKAQAA